MSIFNEEPFLKTGHYTFMCHSRDCGRTEFTATPDGHIVCPMCGSKYQFNSLLQDWVHIITKKTNRRIRKPKETKELDDESPV